MSEIRFDGDTTGPRQSPASQKAEFYYPNHKKRMRLMVVQLPLMALLVDMILALCFLNTIISMPMPAQMAMLYAMAIVVFVLFLYVCAFFLRMRISVNETVYVRLKSDNSVWCVNLTQLALATRQKLPGANLFYVKNNLKLRPEQKADLENRILEAIENNPNGIIGNSIMKMSNVQIVKDAEWYRRVSFYANGGIVHTVNIAKIYDGLNFAGEAEFQTKKEKTIAVTFSVLVLLAFLLPLGWGKFISTPPESAQKPVVGEKIPAESGEKADKEVPYTLDGVSFTVPSTFTSEDGELFFNKTGEQLYSIAVMAVESEEAFQEILDTIKADAAGISGFKGLTAKVNEQSYGSIVDANNTQCFYNIYTIDTSEAFACHQAVMYCPAANKLVSVMGAAASKSLEQEIRKQTEKIFLTAAFMEE